MKLEDVGLDVRCYNKDGKLVRGLEASNHGVLWQFVIGSGEVVVQFGHPDQVNWPNQNPNQNLDQQNQ